MALPALEWPSHYRLDDVLSVDLHVHVAAIEETCVNASKEYSLEKNMDGMEAEWVSLVFECKEYRATGTHILSGVDEVQVSHATSSSQRRRHVADPVLSWGRTGKRIQPSFNPHSTLIQPVRTGKRRCCWTTTS